jgi:undecaprenyl diphosphate synthase
MVKMMKSKINPDRLPKHIAIIMDGNGTWAKKRGLSRNYGHKKGAIVLKDIMLHAAKLKLKYLTVFAFSTENWKRPQEEVNYLMELPKEFINEYEEDMITEKIRLHWIGSKDRLSEDVLKQIERVEEKTKDNKGLTFTIAFNYGGRDEIINAVNNILKEGRTAITAEDFNQYLYSQELPDVDLLIRTSNQLRISNFLLWKLAYSELYFTDVLWPDFRIKDFEKAIIEYQRRERRFGGIK